MDKFLIQGGTPLEGQIAVSGAKNAALPILAASLLTNEKVILGRIPDVRDIRTMEKLLSHTGARVKRERGTVIVEASDITKPEALPTRWSKPCARPASCWDLWWPVAAAPGFRSPAAARSGQGRSIFTS